jgi:uncharacterized protein (TIGR02147 family)
MLNIYDYLDYKKYLADLFEEKKAENKFFSIRVMARKMDLDASYLFRIIYGKNNLTDKYLIAFAKWMNFDEKQKQYLELMTRFSKAKNENETRDLFQKLMAFRRFPSVRVHADRYQYFSKWYHAVIRSLIGIFDFKESQYGTIAKILSPSISLPEARKSLVLLQKLGLIQKSSDGKLEVTQIHLTTAEEYRSVAIRSYQRENIALGMEAIERHEVLKRDISSLTVCVDSDALEDIKDITREYRKAVLDRCEGVLKPDQVYQFNLQMFPVSEKLEV